MWIFGEPSLVRAGTLSSRSLTDLYGKLLDIKYGVSGVWICFNGRSVLGRKVSLKPLRTQILSGGESNWGKSGQSHQR